MSNFLIKYAEGMQALFEGTNGTDHVMAKYWRWFIAHAAHSTSNGLTKGAKNANELVHTGCIEPQQCYRNAMLVEFITGQQEKVPSLQYMEGLALHEPGIPIQHAWNWHNEQVYDFTTALHWSSVPMEWYGVLVPSVFIWQWNEAPAKERRAYTPLQYYFANHVLPGLVFPPGGHIINSQSNPYE